MDDLEYERLAATEQRMWWFQGLHANLIAAWRRAATPRRAPLVLDAGCGTGGLLLRLGVAAPQATLIGLDRHVLACSLARRQSRRPVCAGSIDALPFADMVFDAVFSADVLCHDGVDQVAALATIARCLRPQGVVVLNLPAYRWLFSAHDRSVANVRRYGRDEVRRLLAAAGFAEIRVRHWNTVLFPLMVLRRWFGRTASNPASDVALLPAPIERLFRAIIMVESVLFRAGVPLPFGGSILATAVNP